MDDYTWMIRGRKETKQAVWIKKSNQKVSDNQETPKVDGFEKIKILSTRIQWKHIQKGEGGKLIEQEIVKKPRPSNKRDSKGDGATNDDSKMDMSYDSFTDGESPDGNTKAENQISLFDSNKQLI